MEKQQGGNFADKVERLTEKFKSRWRKDRMIKIVAILYPIVFLWVLFEGREPGTGLIIHILKTPFLALIGDVCLLGFVFLCLAGLNTFLKPFRTSSKPVYTEASTENEAFFDRSNMNTVRSTPRYTQAPGGNTPGYTQPATGGGDFFDQANRNAVMGNNGYTPQADASAQTQTQQTGGGF